MEKKGRQIFSKIVHASKLTRLRTLQTNNVHLDMIMAAIDSIGRSDKKNFLDSWWVDRNK